MDHCDLSTARVTERAGVCGIQKEAPIMKTAEDILNEKKRDMVWVREDQMVFDAVRVMVDNAIGAVLIKKKGRMVRWCAIMATTRTNRAVCAKRPAAMIRCRP